MILTFNDLFITNDDGTFSNIVKIKIGTSTIDNITIGDMLLPGFNVNLADCKNSKFVIEKDENEYHMILEIR